jgi:hypothetical protein
LLAFPLSEALNPRACSRDLRKLAPLEAILFDIDGTLCDSDPFHFLAFRDLLQQVRLCRQRRRSDLVTSTVLDLISPRV